MEPSSLASAMPASPGADGATAGIDPTAARFQEALNRPDAGDVYVDGASAAAAGNPLVGVVNAFDSLKLTPATSHRSSGAENRDTAYDSDRDRDDDRDEQRPEDDSFSDFGDALLAVQSQILRTTLMMETMNTAKQGVTTVFQQQG